MSVSASFDESAVTVGPGGEATISVQVLNSGSTVEEVRFEAVGPCAAWTTAEPESLTLYPGTSGSTMLHLRPPRAPETAPGETTLGLRVAPTSGANEPVVPERTVTVAPFTDLTAELLPRTSQNAWRGRHRVAVDNRGNTPVTVALAVRAGTDRTRAVLGDAELTLPPGETKIGALRIKPVDRVWRGPSVTHPFQAVVTPAPVGDRPADPATVLDGSYEQQAILPRWLPRALVLGLVAAGILVGLWYGVMRPAVKSAARAAVTPEVVHKALDTPPGTNGGASGTPGAAGGGTGSGPGAGGGAGQPGGTAGASGGTGATGAPGAGSSSPKSTQLSVKSTAGGARAESVYPVPAGHTFELTDLVVQNPQGDAGTMVVSTPDSTILSLALENFRDSDYHFVTPIEVPAGGKVTLSVECHEVGKPVKAPAPSQCSELLFLGGTVRAGSSSPAG